MEILRIVFILDDDIATQELIDKLQRQVDKMEIRLRHKRSSSRDLEKLLESPKANGSCTVVGECAFDNTDCCIYPKYLNVF